ncbi:eukaryotic translation initiation factor 2 subunit beta [Anaeramoeba ignava]|uniref:Eukaryotic translation initiation factor 2 subunit beta n=1 Tax=Anaeramoeba ignava TaxID=1746090 RepID=A0A9Q0LI46_ANAIG|nr:eukaryotic translation initiation factor 2 subunit beta [Anaeramoeba ignava]|eukprot:Anaeramoba_ignava/a561_129.p1 GENE.a561_129~~a561_129.p1  ORF type:complete len:284 (-),score=72.80 a561_129:342-1193(-)
MSTVPSLNLSGKKKKSRKPKSKTNTNQPKKTTKSPTQANPVTPPPDITLSLPARKKKSSKSKGKSKSDSNKTQKQNLNGNKNNAKNPIEKDKEVEAEPSISPVPNDPPENLKKILENLEQLKSEPEYTYDDLLSRIFSKLKENHPRFLGESRQFVMPPPDVGKLGGKKVVLFNALELCNIMRRPPEHVLSFFFAELGTTGSIDGDGRFIIKGRYQAKHIESVLRSYINQYVRCSVCGRYQTSLVHNNRLYFIKCDSCEAQKTVVQIKSTQHAPAEKKKNLKKV